MNNVIILATYWNEIDWIRPSLAQIDKLDPLEVVICDGCFDERYPVHSTDGTREVIEEYTSNRQHAYLVSPVRLSRVRALIALWLGHKHSPAHLRTGYARLRGALSSLRRHPYRVNQALTFNYMISITKRW